MSSLEKVTWLIIWIILLFGIEVHWIVGGILGIYSIYLGAYFRGKNWFIGWNRVNTTKDKVKFTKN